MDTGNPFILRELRRLIGKKGRITFEQFMDTALYHPEYGYYTSGRARIGREGDYYTSSEVHRAFGFCIMRQIEEMGRILNRSPIHLVEIGAGKGLLCADILTSARERSPTLFEALRYFIVEKSLDFIERQKRHIEELGLMDKVTWVPEAKEALSPSLSLRERVKGEGGVGIILSNELIDAFPVHRVRYSNGLWQEIYVTFKDGIFTEIEGTLSNQRLADFLIRLEGSSLPVETGRWPVSDAPPERLYNEGRGEGSAFEEGYTTEVNLRALDWINEVGNALKEGFIITIDYGYPRRELYSTERNRGTLMCYYKHQASENPYVNIGEQDITAHVDFTSLAEAGKAVGLDVTGFTDQSYFLMGCGIEEEFQPVDGINRDTLDTFSSNITLKKLLMPGGMGSAFKVLIQHKGMGKPRLRGFSFRDMAKYLQ